jgi:hypothetical protein
MSETLNTGGSVVVWKHSLAGQKVHAPFRVKLPFHSRIVRAGIEPGVGTPAFWFITDPEISSEETTTHEERYFMVAFTGHKVLSPVTHHGMWWEADFVFHLFELHNDPSLLVNIFKDEE